MNLPSIQFRAAAVLSGLLVGLSACTNVPPPSAQVIAPTAPPVCQNTGEDFQPPVVKHTVAPEFPLEMRRSGASGHVTIDCEISDRGRVQNPKAIEASDPSLIGPVLDAIRRWEFAPATRAGRPVATQATIPLRFALNN